MDVAAIFIDVNIKVTYNNIMRKIHLLLLLMMCSTAQAKTKNIYNDYGILLSENKFTAHCVLSDIGLSGADTFNVYSSGQVSCTNIYKIYKEAYVQMRDFLQTEGYLVDSDASQKSLVIRVVTLADLNNPDNFSNTDKKCMRDINCSSGAYFGRTFFSRYSNIINIYVVYNVNIESNFQYSFISTLKHELMHAILYRYGWHYSMNEYKEEQLILMFLNWTAKNK